MMKKVLISGAGVAGSTLAFWMHYHGFAVTVVEQAPNRRLGGQAVDIRGAALNVVERMGIGAELRMVRTMMRGMTLLDGEGVEIVRSIEATFSSGRLDNSDVELLLEDVTRLLHEHTCDAIRYMFGDSIVAIDERAGGVHVTFEGAQPCMFDLVIGADGLHSQVRTLTFGEVRKFLLPLGMQIAVFSADNFLALDNWQIWLRGGDAGYGIYPVRGNSELRITLGFALDDSEVDHRDVDGQKHRAAQRLAHLRWKTPTILEAMWKAKDFYTDAMAQIHMPRWSRGRVALVGDAAYCPSPLSGQGTSLALVGAYVMASELAKLRHDYLAAFARYEDRMRPFVSRNQALATERPGQPASTEAIDAAKNAIAIDTELPIPYANSASSF